MQPGIILDQLNRQLASYGLQYAPDPTTSNRACVGGGIGNNTCGAHSVLYGKTLDHVLEVDTILSDASRTHFGPLEAHELEAKLSGTGLGVPHLPGHSFHCPGEPGRDHRPLPPDSPPGQRL